MRRDTNTLLQIKADDPGGTIEEAAAALALLEVTSDRAEYRVNVRVVGDRYGLAVAEAIRLVIEANYPAWVHDHFVGDGLNICSQSTQDSLTTPPFSTEQVAMLIGFAKEKTQKYPGIKPVHVQEARAL